MDAATAREEPAPSGGHPRFLILPWVHIPNLGSHILAIVRRRLPIDWTERYNTTPVLIETFVETPRYTGAVYRASGWIRVGTTQGRGRYDREKLCNKPRKDVWLRPLRRIGSAPSIGKILAPGSVLSRSEGTERIAFSTARPNEYVLSAYPAPRNRPTVLTMCLLAFHYRIKNNVWRALTH